MIPDADPRVLEHAKVHNPFDIRFVAGPYDHRDLPIDESAMRPALEEMARIFNLHDQRAPAFAHAPQVPIVGDTGSGKSTLLNVLATRGHEAGSRLFIDIPPRDFLRAAEGAEAGIELLLRRVERVILGHEAPGFETIRPIDLLAHRILQKLGTIDGAADVIRVPRLFFFRRPLPDVFWELIRSPDHKPDCRLDSIDFEEDRAVVQRAIATLARTTRQLVRMPGGDLRARIVEAAFSGGDAQSAVVGGLPGQEIDDLLAFVSLADFLGFPVVFVFDQFEDLQADSTASVPDLVRTFCLRLNDLIKVIIGGRPEGVRPLFLMAMARDFDPTDKLEEHFKERFPILDGSRRSVDLSGLFGPQVRDPKVALSIARRYIEETWRRAERERLPRPPSPLWPLSEAILLQIHEQDRHEIQTVRSWLVRCHTAWARAVKPSQSGSDDDPAGGDIKPVHLDDKALLSGGKDVRLDPHPHPVAPAAGLALAGLVADKDFRQAARKGLFDASDMTLFSRVKTFLDVLHQVGVLDCPPEIPSDRFWFSVGGVGVMATIFTRTNQGGAHTIEWEKFKEICAQEKNRRGLAGVKCALYLRTKGASFPDGMRLGHTKVLTHVLGDEDAAIIHGVLVAADRWGQAYRQQLASLRPGDVQDAIREVVGRWALWKQIGQATVS